MRGWKFSARGFPMGLPTPFTHTHIYKHTHHHTDMHSHTRPNTHTHMHTHAHTHTRTHTYLLPTHPILTVIWNIC